MIKVEGDGDLEPTLYVSETTRIDFDQWSFDISLEKPLREVFSDVATVVMEECVGYRDGQRTDMSMVILDWPWANHDGSWRDNVEIAEPPSDPLDLDINYGSADGGNYAVARYNMRAMLMSYAEDCAADGSWLSELQDAQAALRRLADDLQPAIEKGLQAESRRAAKSVSEVKP